MGRCLQWCFLKEDVGKGGFLHGGVWANGFFKKITVVSERRFIKQHVFETGGHMIMMMQHDDDAPFQTPPLKKTPFQHPL